MLVLLTTRQLATALVKAAIYLPLLGLSPVLQVTGPATQSYSHTPIRATSLNHRSICHIPLPKILQPFSGMPISFPLLLQ